MAQPERDPACKTYALVKRLASLLELGVEAKEILVVTFARTAARDLVGAVAALDADGEALIPRTLHGFCFSLLSRERVLQATKRVPRILLGFEKDILLNDLEGAFGGLKARRALIVTFEAAWARRLTDELGQPVPGLDQSFRDAFLTCLRWHKAMLVGKARAYSAELLPQQPAGDSRMLTRTTALMYPRAPSSNVACVREDPQKPRRVKDQAKIKQTRKTAATSEYQRTRKPLFHRHSRPPDTIDRARDRLCKQEVDGSIPSGSIGE